MKKMGTILLSVVASLLFVVTGCTSTRDRSGDLNEDALVVPSLAMTTTRVISEESMAPVSVVAPEGVEEVVVQSLVTGSGGITIYRLQVGDPVVINLRGIYPRDESIEDIVDEAGNVSIPHIGDIPALGKSTAELERDISRLYVEGGYYRNITVNVLMPARTYFIRGEVRSPGRFPVVGGLTLNQAIAAAGGYTEFANQRNVKLLRGGTTQTINMRQINRNPEMDFRLESGDVIVVERSIF